MARGIELPEAGAGALEGDLEPDDDDQELLGKVVDFYHATLLKSAEAQAFLGRFGLDDPGLIEHFRLGLANRTLAYRLPKTIHKKGAALRARLQELGILRSSGHEHLRGSLVVPVLDRTGAIVQLYGHKVGERLRAGTPLELWLETRPPAIFNVAALVHAEVVITAAILDALSMWRAGIAAVMAIPSLSFEAESLLEAMHGSAVRKVVLAFPRSRQAAEAEVKLAEALGQAGMEVHRVAFPASMGARAFAMSVGDASECFRALLRSSEWLAGTPARRNSPAPERHASSVIEPEPRPASTVSTSAARAADDDEMVMTLDDRRWRLRGLADAKARGTLRLNVFVSREDVGFHVDRFDLYSSRHRAAFVKLAAQEIAVDEPVVKRDLGKVLLACEQAQEQLLQSLQEPVTRQVELTPEQRDEALELLRDPKLLDRVLDDFERVGVVGERDNLLVAFLATISRKLAHPLAALVQSSSAAGKSSLLTAVLDFVPDEDRVIYSAMTGQSLYYVGANDLRHKVLSIAEEQGAERAAYSLKLLQSDGSLTIASTGKETGTGRLISHEYRVHGPVALMMTTSKVQLDAELLNRCLVVAVDESPEQTRRIQERQRWRQTLDGMLAHERREAIYRLHHNAQRLLRPVRVVNALAPAMSYGDHRVRARRDHQKLLSLIEALALLHQHQRRLESVAVDGGMVEYVEVDPEDIDIAVQLMKQVGTVGPDDLPPHTRHVLDLLDQMVVEMANETGAAREEIRFSRRQARERLRLGDTQLWLHMRRLVATEYLVVHPSHRGRAVVYELACSGHCTTPDIREPSAWIRGESGPDPGGVRGGVSAKKAVECSAKPASPTAEAQKRKQGAVQTPSAVRTPPGTS